MSFPHALALKRVVRYGLEEFGWNGRKGERV